MNQALFLHYGPGGNSYAEKEILGIFTDNINFWDQPKVKNSSTPYQSLVAECEKQIIKMNDPCNLIAHSFGCDLAASLLIKNPKLIGKVILISPLRHFPICFKNLGNKLHAAQADTALNSALTSISPYSKKMEAPAFWNLVSNIVTHPAYFTSFWKSQETMQKFIALATLAPANDSEEFQIVLQDYIFTNPQDNFSNLKNSNIHVIISTDDPYYTEDDFQYWLKVIGTENVTLLKNVGHFPHLEDPSCLLKLL
jgi:pimeloyl-ACP methyl ester carboxylesterase